MDECYSRLSEFLDNGPFTHAYKKRKSELLSGNSRNHAEYLLHTAKNSVQKLDKLYWRMYDPYGSESVPNLGTYTDVWREPLVKHNYLYVCQVECLLPTL